MNFFTNKEKEPLSKKNLSYNHKSSETKQLIAPQNSKTTQIFSEYLGKFTDKVSQSVNNLTNKSQDISNTMTNWKYFLGFFLFGVLLIFLSFPYLSILVIAPQKFAGLFTLGSISVLVSMGILKGTWGFIKSFFTKEKILFSIVYLGSLVGTFYVAIIKKNYVLVIIFSFVQVFSFTIN